MEMTNIQLIQKLMDDALAEMRYRFARWYLLGIPYEHPIEKEKI